jgi:hypothetical protein
MLMIPSGRSAASDAAIRAHLIGAGCLTPKCDVRDIDPGVVGAGLPFLAINDAGRIAAAPERASANGGEGRMRPTPPPAAALNEAA